jgi:carbamoyl-phosphate synthase large subunit
LAAVRELCQREQVRVLLPQTTREIEVLSHAIDDFARFGVAIAVVRPMALALANNKAALMARMDEDPELRPMVPRHRLASDRSALIEAAGELGYPARPVAVKPPLSNGMRGFRVLCHEGWDLDRFLNEKPSAVEITLEQLLAMLDRGSQWPALLVSEYLPGAEYSVDAFRGQRVAVALPRLRRVIRSGISFDNQFEYRNDLIDATLRAADLIGLQGVFGFQFKLDAAGAPKVLECNPRVQGTMVASVFAGVNVIWLAVREAMGQPVLAIDDPRREARFVRYWGGVGIVDDRVFEV